MKALMKPAVASIKRFAADEEAATAAEYGIIAALIAAVIMGAVGLLGGSLKTMFTNLDNKVKTAPAQ